MERKPTVRRIVALVLILTCALSLLSANAAADAAADPTASSCPVGDPTPVGGMPIRPTPIGGTPIGGTPIGTAPIDTMPIDTMPIDTTPSDTTPIDTQGCKPVLDAPTVTVSQNGATITWTTTLVSDSAVEYGPTTTLGTPVKDPTTGTNHSITLSGLLSNTKYYYVAKSTNSAGTGTSMIENFTTLAAADTTAPSISSLAASNVTQTTAVIAWTTNEAADTQVEYGTTTTYGETTPLDINRATSHSETLRFLSPNTTYYFRVNSRDSAGNLGRKTASFKTLALENTPPTISGVTVSNVTATGAKIQWNTDEVADSQVEYGLTDTYGSNTARDWNLVKTHSWSLTQLKSSTIYHYRVRSTDPSGNVAYSPDAMFATSDVTPPAITGLVVSKITATEAVINWRTNEPATSQISYAKAGSATRVTTPEVTQLQSDQAVTLTGLSPGIAYSYYAISKDEAGNKQTSPSNSFATPNDTFEPNDSGTQAKTIAAGSVYTSYISSSGDVDYYAFTPTQDQAVLIELTVPSAMNYDVVLLDGSVEMARSRNGLGQAEAVSLFVASGRRYFIRIESPSASFSPSLTYSLRLTYQPPQVMAFLSPAEGASLVGDVTLTAQPPAGVSTLSQVIYRSDGTQIAVAYPSGFAATWNTTSVPAGHHILSVQGQNSSGQAVTGSGLVNVTVQPQAHVITPLSGAKVTQTVQLKGSANFPMATASFSLIQNGVTTALGNALIYDNPSPDRDPPQWATLDWTPTPGATGSATLRFTAGAVGGTSPSSTDISITLDVAALDPFLASIQTSPGDQSQWISNMNVSIDHYWIYWEDKWASQGNPHVTGYFKSLNTGKQVGCAPISAPTMDCASQLAMSQIKVQQLWDSALRNKIDPRLYMAILMHEGTGSFNSKPGEGGQDCKGNCANPDFEEDLRLVGEHLVPQKIRAYAYADLFRRAWPDADIFQYLGWYTTMDRNGGESGIYAQHFTWHDGVRSNYEALGGNARALTDYILRTGKRGASGFVPTTFSSSKYWNTNTVAGSEGTPVAGFQYSKNGDGSDELPPPPNTLWWLTPSSTTGSTSVATDDPSWTTADLTDLKSINLVAPATLTDDWLYMDQTIDGTPTTGTPTTGTPATGTPTDGTTVASPTPDGTIGIAPIQLSASTVGTFTSRYFTVSIPSGYKKWSTISGDQWVMWNGKASDPKITVYINPQTAGLRGVDQFKTRWQFIEKAVQTVSGYVPAAGYQNGVPTGRIVSTRVLFYRASQDDTQTYTVVSAMETWDGHVQILMITMPSASRRNWYSVTQNIVGSFKPQVSLGR